jgi:hypothetical protein
MWAYLVLPYGVVVSSIVYFFDYLVAFKVATTAIATAALFSLSFTICARCVTRWTTAGQMFHTVGIFGFLVSLRVLHRLH